MPGSKLVIANKAATTASNILAHESLFRLGFAAYILNVAVYLVVTLLFYELFQPVNRSVCLLAASFSLMGCALNAASSAFYLAPLLVLGGAPYLSVFTAGQLPALGLLFLKLHAQTYNIGVIFFGFYCLLIGYLVWRANFLPRFLGALMMFAGYGRERGEMAGAGR